MSNLLNVAYYSFKDLVKSKVLFNVFFIGIALLIVSFVASELTFGVPQRIALDFGLGTLSLSTVAISILMGSSLVANEIDQRTIFMILSKPIYRFEFLLGKILGISGILFSNIFLLSFIVISFYLFLGGEFYNSILWILAFIFFEGLICLLLVLNFSLITNKTLAIIYSFSLFVAGHSVNDSLIERFKDNSVIHGVLENYHYIFPNFYRINFKDFVIYGEPLETEFLISSLSYSIFYSFALICLSCWLLQNKNID